MEHMIRANESYNDPKVTEVGSFFMSFLIRDQGRAALQLRRVTMMITGAVATRHNFFFSLKLENGTSCRFYRPSSSALIHTQIAQSFFKEKM